MNVSALPEIQRADNGGEYLELHVRRALAVASTTDGRYFLRVADESKPVVGDVVMRLAAERSALPWETQTTLRVTRESAGQARCPGGGHPRLRPGQAFGQGEDRRRAPQPLPPRRRRVAHQSRRAVLGHAGGPGTAGHRSGHPVHQIRCAGAQGQQARLGRPHPLADRTGGSRLARGSRRPPAARRCARFGQTAGRVASFAELDRWHPAGKRGLRAAAGRPYRESAGRHRAVHPRSVAHASAAGEDCPDPRPVRDHPPVPGRQRSYRSPADCRNARACCPNP